MDAIIAAKGGERKLPAFTGEREGFTFTGWVGDDGASYADEATITPQADLVLTAQWGQNTVSVNFAANGGTGDMPAVSHSAGNDYTVPSCAFTAPEGRSLLRLAGRGMSRKAISPGLRSRAWPGLHPDRPVG